MNICLFTEDNVDFEEDTADEKNTTPELSIRDVDGTGEYV